MYDLSYRLSVTLSQFAGCTLRPHLPNIRLVVLGCLLIGLPLATGETTSNGSSASNFLDRGQTTPLASPPVITGLTHSILHYDKAHYCGHPRMVGFAYFGNGELLVGHFHAPSKYQVYDDVRHVAYQGRAVCLMQRSTDGGKSWPKENDIIVYDRTKSPAEEAAFLGQSPDKRATDLNMFSPNSLFFSQHTSELRPPVRTFFLRSIDKGKTWESVPTVVKHPDGDDLFLTRHDTPVIRMPDGKTLLGSFTMGDKKSGKELDGEPAIFQSTDQGLTWTFLSRPVVDKSGTGRMIYPTLLLLPNGDLQCYVVHLKRRDETVKGVQNAISVVASKDGGKTWSNPLPIVGQGNHCWKNPGHEGLMYRSPWPILLKDGRILVVFARRRMPAGIGGVVSSDGGKTWSPEFVVRDDAKKWNEKKHEEGDWGDLGYPVGCQLEDGSIFIAYYFNKDDGWPQGGTRFIASSTFRIEP